MRVLDATWEKRNLGVSCYELHVAPKEPTDEIALEYSALEKREYMVVRIPSTHYEACDFFQQQGFRFIEAAISLTHSMKSIPLSARFRRIAERCSWQAMTEEDISQMDLEIDRNIFKTDRISLDPAFSPQQASQRYKLWIKDLIGLGTVPYKVMYDGNTIGFFLATQPEPDVFDGVLAAVYSEYEGTGMGFCVQYAGLKYAADKGAKKYLGHITANNPAVMKILSSLGFEINTIEYVFVKHN